MDHWMDKEYARLYMIKLMKNHMDARLCRELTAAEGQAAWGPEHSKPAGHPNRMPSGFTKT